MKKLFIMIAVFAAVSFASCGHKTAEAEAVESDTILVVEDTVEVVDTIAVDTLVAE